MHLISNDTHKMMSDKMLGCFHISITKDGKDLYLIDTYNGIKDNNI